MNSIPLRAADDASPAGSGGCSSCETKCLSGKLAHGGNPVLRWMAGNVSIEQDAADNWKPSKKRSRERIDGIVALIMAVGRASLQVAPRVGTFYETHELEMA